MTREEISAAVSAAYPQPQNYGELWMARAKLGVAPFVCGVVSESVTPEELQAKLEFAPAQFGPAIKGTAGKFYAEAFTLPDGGHSFALAHKNGFFEYRITFLSDDPNWTPPAA